MAQIMVAAAQGDVCSDLVYLREKAIADQEAEEERVIASGASGQQIMGMKLVMAMGIVDIKEAASKDPEAYCARARAEFDADPSANPYLALSGTAQ